MPGVVPWAGVPEQGLDPVLDEAIEIAVVILERSRDIAGLAGRILRTPREQRADATPRTTDGLAPGIGGK